MPPIFAALLSDYIRKTYGTNNDGTLRLAPLALSLAEAQLAESGRSTESIKRAKRKYELKRKYTGILSAWCSDPDGLPSGENLRRLWKATGLTPSYWLLGPQDPERNTPWRAEWWGVPGNNLVFMQEFFRAAARQQLEKRKEAVEALSRREESAGGGGLGLFTAGDRILEKVDAQAIEWMRAMQSEVRKFVDAEIYTSTRRRDG